MPENRLLALVLIFAPLSVVSIGGGPGIFAEMQLTRLAATAASTASAPTRRRTVSCCVRWWCSARPMT